MVLRTFYWLRGWRISVVNSVVRTFGEGMYYFLSCPIKIRLFEHIIFRSVHNVRIERLWVDVTAQVGAYWAELFIHLELQHGLDINNIHHIWLLQHLFLHVINEQLSFWAASWNQHKLQIRGGPNRSPADLFVFDMLVHGVRGDQLPNEEELSAEEMEVYGVDWEGLRDDQLLRAQRQNNPADEEGSSWVGRSGPPANLSEVSVEPPTGDLMQQEIVGLDSAVEHWYQFADDASRMSLWAQGLGCAKAMRGDLF